MSGDLLLSALRARDPRYRRPCSVYRYFDKRDRLLYVGITTAGLSRADDHSRHSRWWTKATHATLVHYPTVIEALAAEDAAIRDEHPIYNRTGPDCDQTSSIKSPKSRPNGSGSVYYVATPRRWHWCASVTVGWSALGTPRRRSRYAATREEAERLLDQMLDELDPAEVSA